MFTACLTLHLFYLSVFYKNLAKLEAVYVLCSVFVPLVIAFFTKSYGPSEAWCWIQNRNLSESMNISNENLIQPAETEQFVLFYGPAFVILIVCVAAVVVMGVVLSCRAYRRNEGWQVIGEEQHRQLLKQLLPLIAYPILLLLFFITPFVNRLYTKFTPIPPHSLVYTAVFFVCSWSMAPGMALLIHMVVIFCIVRRRRSIRSRWMGAIERDGTRTAKQSRTAERLVNSDTSYIIPSES